MELRIQYTAIATTAIPSTEILDESTLAESAYSTLISQTQQRSVFVCTPKWRLCPSRRFSSVFARIDSVFRAIRPPVPLAIPETAFPAKSPSFENE